MSGISGLEQLDPLLAYFEELQSIAQAAAPQAAKDIGSLARAQWNAGKAPDGSSWEKAKDGHTPLRGAAQSIDIFPRGKDVVFDIPEPYTFHQTGTEKLPKRQLVPSKGEPLPKTWEKAIELAIEKEIIKRKPPV